MNTAEYFSNVVALYEDIEEFVNSSLKDDDSILVEDQSGSGRQVGYVSCINQDGFNDGTTSRAYLIRIVKHPDGNINWQVIASRNVDLDEYIDLNFLGDE